MNLLRTFIFLAVTCCAAGAYAQNEPSYALGTHDRISLSGIDRLTIRPATTARLEFDNYRPGHTARTTTENGAFALAIRDDSHGNTHRKREKPTSATLYLSPANLRTLQLSAIGMVTGELPAGTRLELRLSSIGSLKLGGTLSGPLELEASACGEVDLHRLQLAEPVLLRAHAANLVFSETARLTFSDQNPSVTIKRVGHGSDEKP